MDLAFNGRLAVITGADSGIGLHTAMTLAAEGAKVLLSDLEEKALETALKRVKEHAPDAVVYTVAADLTKPADVDKLRDAADERGARRCSRTSPERAGRRGTFWS